MRRIKRFLMFAVFVVLPGSSGVASALERLAVFDLEAQGVDSLEAAAGTRFLVTDIVKTGKFIVLDRANMERVLGEQTFQRSGITSPQDAVRLGKLLNVQKILLGNLLKLGGEYYLDVNVVDVETAAIALAARERWRSMDELPQLTQKIAQQLAQMTIPEEIEALSKEPEPSPEEKELALWVSSGLLRRDYLAYKESGVPVEQWALAQTKSPAIALGMAVVPVASGLYYTGDTGWGMFVSVSELLVTVGAITQPEKRSVFLGSLTLLTVGDTVFSWLRARGRNQELGRVAHEGPRILRPEKGEK